MDSEARKATVCLGKEGFKTKAKAVEVLKKQKKRGNLKGRHNGKSTLDVYKCNFCGLWHIGSMVRK